MLANFVAHDPFTSALVQAIALLFLIRFLDLWEQEPAWVVLALALWGMLGATSIALVGNRFVESLMSRDVQVVWGAALSAPLVEETAKGLGLVAAVYASRWTLRRFGVAEFDGPLDGLVMGAAIGIGFAFAENNFYSTYNAGNEIQHGIQLLHFREGFLGLRTLGHAIYTGAFGAGLGMATWSRTRAGQIGWPLAGLAVAMFLHAVQDGLLSLILVGQFGFHATAVGLGGGALPAAVAARMSAALNSANVVLTVVDYTLVAAFFAAMLLLLRYQRRILAYALYEEVAGGLITGDECELITHYGRRLRWYLQLLAKGRFAQLVPLRRAHAQIIDLAFWKWRVERVGGDAAGIERRRASVRDLRAQLAAAAAGPG